MGLHVREEQDNVELIFAFFDALYVIQVKNWKKLMLHKWLKQLKKNETYKLSVSAAWFWETNAKNVFAIIHCGENKTKVLLEIFIPHKRERNKQLNMFDQVLFWNYINYLWFEYF